VPDRGQDRTGLPTIVAQAESRVPRCAGAHHLWNQAGGCSGKHAGGCSQIPGPVLMPVGIGVVPVPSCSTALGQ
jgi:hypothetical protein